MESGKGTNLDHAEIYNWAVRLLICFQIQFTFIVQYHLHKGTQFALSIIKSDIGATDIRRFTFFLRFLFLSCFINLFLIHFVLSCVEGGLFCIFLACVCEAPLRLCTKNFSQKVE